MQILDTPVAGMSWAVLDERLREKEVLDDREEEGTVMTWTDEKQPLGERDKGKW